jgi:membrane protein required for colicin V production
MSIVDIIILICFIPFLVKGFLNGLIRQIIGIASLILGVWSSYKFSSIVASWITEWVEASGPVINIISFTLVFIVSLLLFPYLAKCSKVASDSSCSVG